MATPDIDPPVSTQAPVLVSAIAALRVVCAWRECSAEFDAMHSLASHLSISHLDSAPHANNHACMWQGCPQYGVPAPTRYDLIMHLKVHTGDRAYLCPFDGCHKSYIRSEFLPRHITTTHANSDAAAALLSTRQTPVRAKPPRRAAPPRAEPLTVISDSDSDSDSYHPSSSEAMLEAQLAYIREQVEDRTKKLTRIKEKSRRLRMENDILLDAIENA
ncbi:Zinc finger protein ZIC 4 [Coemansia sp. BCRC 34301]|nr:Zinc finger protein ZIC 4 [Coemansia sp. BCRC 34301]